MKTYIAKHPDFVAWWLDTFTYTSAVWVDDSRTKVKRMVNATYLRIRGTDSTIFIPRTLHEASVIFFNKQKPLKMRVQKNKKLSDEHKARISAGQRARHAKRRAESEKADDACQNT